MPAPTYADALVDDNMIRLLQAMQVGDAPLRAEAAPSASSHSRTATEQPTTQAARSAQVQPAQARLSQVVQSTQAIHPPQGVLAAPAVSLAVSVNPAPAPLSEPAQTPPQIYAVTSSEHTGIVSGWALGGHLTQRRPDGHVRKLKELSGQKKCRRHGPRYQAYVVFEGVVPGVYDTWEEVSPLIRHVSRAVHNGFNSRLDAERAYALAYANGGVRVLTSRSGGLSRAPAAPMSPAIMQAFRECDENFLGREWYVVFKGRTPGIYPSWNFAATQVNGVSGAVHDMYFSKEEAVKAYDDAVKDGLVEYL